MAGEGAPLAVENPATEETVAEVAVASPERVDAAVAGAREPLREETFGPLAPIVPVRSLDETIELANGTRFGLGGNVYTGDLATAVRCMRELKAGTV